MPQGCETCRSTILEGSSGRYEPAALDHVFATDGLTFRNQRNGAKVLVGGWLGFGANNHEAG